MLGSNIYIYMMFWNGVYIISCKNDDKANWRGALMVVMTIMKGAFFSTSFCMTIDATAQFMFKLWQCKVMTKFYILTCFNATLIYSGLEKAVKASEQDTRKWKNKIHIANSQHSWDKAFTRWWWNATALIFHPIFLM